MIKLMNNNKLQPNKPCTPLPWPLPCYRRAEKKIYLRVSACFQRFNKDPRQVECGHAVEGWQRM